MSSDVTSNLSQRNINSANSFVEGIYEFDRFRLDAPHRMLYENNQPVQLAPKVVETLIALVERRGEVVSKDELMARLWKDSFVEESNLTQNIYLLRKTLGKGAGGRDLIESFRRRGYRFNGQIKEVQAEQKAEGTLKRELRTPEEEAATADAASETVEARRKAVETSKTASSGKRFSGWKPRFAAAGGFRFDADFLARKNERDANGCEYNRQTLDAGH